MPIHVPTCIRTLRLKVKSEAYAWLNAAATEVNQVWNWANETSSKAARPFAGPGKWLSGFDLDKLAAGASDYFEHIGSHTIQRVNAEFATRRRQFKRVKLRWRVSRGARRSLGWIPFKAVQVKRKGKSPHTRRWVWIWGSKTRLRRATGISSRRGSFTDTLSGRLPKPNGAVISARRSVYTARPRAAAMRPCIGFPE